MLLRVRRALTANVLERGVLRVDAERGGLLEAGAERVLQLGLGPDHGADLLVARHAQRLEDDDDGHVVANGVVLQLQAARAQHDDGARLALVRGRRHARAHRALGVELEDDAVLAQLLLDQAHLFHALDDKVAARVVRALLHRLQLRLARVAQVAPVRPKHHRDAPDAHARRLDHGAACGCAKERAARRMPTREGGRRKDRGKKHHAQKKRTQGTPPPLLPGALLHQQPPPSTHTHAPRT